MKYTKQLMDNYIEEKLCDSYALYLYDKGNRSILTSENVNMDTYFDIASCGKVMTTSTLILKTIGKGMLDLNDTLSTFFPKAPADKRGITIKDLLTHTSGIIRYEFPDDIYTKSHDQIAEWILAHPLAFETGSDYTYSCNGYILLGFILEKIYGKKLAEVFETELKQPLGMTRAGFGLPEGESNRAISHRREADGDFPVDDENLYKMRECAGSGAQFYCMGDAVKLMDAILERSGSLYPRELFDLAEQDHTPNYSMGRGLGYWLVDDRFSPNDPLFPVGSFGHLGSTGTAFCIDRKNDRYIILFTNFRRHIEDGIHYDYTRYMERYAQLRREIYAAVAKDLNANLSES